MLNAPRRANAIVSGTLDGAAVNRITKANQALRLGAT
jgi:hypothetical protein